MEQKAIAMTIVLLFLVKAGLVASIALVVPHRPSVVGRIRVIIDREDETINLHGVTTVLAGEVEHGIHQAILSSAADLDDAQDTEGVTSAKATITALVDAVLSSNSALPRK